MLDPVPTRSGRDRLRAGLAFLGYGRLNEQVWIAPRRSAEVDALLTAEGQGHLALTAAAPTPVSRALAAWDLDGLAAAYDEWLAVARDLTSDPAGDDEHAFATRSQLVHEWRKFLFTDPGLPARLLPDDWPGHVAARFFDEQADHLLPAASRHVDHCLSTS